MHSQIMRSSRQRTTSGTVFAPVSIISVLFCANAFAATGPAQTLEESVRKVQSPTAQSIGTTTDLLEAAQTLMADFATVANRSLPGESREASIAVEDLRRIVQSSDPGIPDGLRDAARFFLASPISRQLAGGDQRKRQSDAGLTMTGLDEAIKIAARGQLGQALTELAKPYLQQDFGLLGDPNLALQLPSPR
jgi:hypothetical protein